VTTLANRPNTALLVIDVQNGVLEGAHERDAVVANVASLVEKERQEQVPVVWVRHSDKDLTQGSDDWQIVPNLDPRDAEPIVDKKFGDSFEATILEAVLSELGVGRLFVVGAQTDARIRSTLHGALVRGYDATLISDAHTTEDQTTWGHPLRTRSSRTRTRTGPIRRRLTDCRDGRDPGSRLRRLIVRHMRRGLDRIGRATRGQRNSRGPAVAEIRGCPRRVGR
jgi:nicotinamidase-related amidase